MNVRTVADTLALVKLSDRKGAGKSPIASAKIYVGSGLHEAHGRHLVNVDPRDFRATVEETVSSHFPGATISKATGYWRGRFEPSLVVEVWDATVKRGRLLADAVRAAHDLVGKLSQIQVAVVADGPRGQHVTYVDRKTVAASRVRIGRQAGRYSSG